VDEPRNKFTSIEFGLYCVEQGIERNLTAPYSPQQNVVVQRRNQTVVGMARSMLKAMKVPAVFWGEAVSTAVIILNCSPTKSLKETTPVEAWHGQKPDISFLCTFGCVGHVKKTKPNLSKLEDRSTPMVFLGYEARSNAYQLFDPRAQRVVISRDVVFDKAACWDRESGWGSKSGWPEQLLHHRVHGVLRCRGAGPRRARGIGSRRDIPYFGNRGSSSTASILKERRSQLLHQALRQGSISQLLATPPPMISPHVDASYGGEPL
jgi:hypothetical protein